MNLFDAIKKKPGYMLVPVRTKTGKPTYKVEFKCRACGKKVRIWISKCSHYEKSGTLPQFCSVECMNMEMSARYALARKKKVEAAIKEYQKMHPEYRPPVEQIECRKCHETKDRNEYGFSRYAPGKGFRDSMCLVCRYPKKQPKHKKKVPLRPQSQIVARMPKWQAEALNLGDSKIIEVY